MAKQDYTDAVAQARQAPMPQLRRTPPRCAARRSICASPECLRRSPGGSACRAFTEGALVTADQADALTTITRLDPVYVDIQQSAADLLALRQALAHGGGDSDDGAGAAQAARWSDYGFTGTVEFSEVVVDQATGTVTVRARFPNPQSILLPGMFVTAQFAQAIDTSAFLVPQQAVSRDPQGNATLWIVGPGNRAVQRTVVADRTQGALLGGHRRASRPARR